MRLLSLVPAAVLLCHPAEPKKLFNRPKIYPFREAEITFRPKIPDWVGWETASGELPRNARDKVAEDPESPTLSPSPPSSTGGESAWFADQFEDGEAQVADCDSHKSCEEVLVKEMEALQFPSDCQARGKRYLFIEFEGSEGVGSTVAMIAQGLAEGFHSNRTTIFGPVMPTMMGLNFMGGKEEGFDTDHPCGKKAVSALDCYLKPITKCKLDDVLVPRRRAEYREFLHNVYDDRGAFKVMEGRRGSPALFTAPKRYRHLKEPHLWWLRVVLSYVFRLKDDKLRDMVTLRENLRLTSPSVGIHIRHGDLNLKFEYGDKAGQRAYMNRPYFEAEDYFTVVRDAIENGLIKEIPKSIYVASDGSQVKETLKTERHNPFWEYDDAAEDKDEDDDDDENLFGLKTRFIHLDRYRNRHGAHTSATLMALPHSAHLELSEISARERSLNFRRMLKESIEDIWLLSQCQYFFGTGSSHFSAIATYLRRDGETYGPPAKAVFLDQQGLVSGEYCPGLFHGTINGTSKLIHPEQRHQIMHRRFLDRLHVVDDLKPGNLFFFDTKRGVYTVPTHTFDQEASRWADPRRSRMWEWGQTDNAVVNNPKRLLERLVHLVNDGATLDNFWSYGAALTGWRHALELLERVDAGDLELDATDEMMDQFQDVVRGNIGVHNSRFAKPYVALLKDPKARVYLSGNK